MSVKQKLKYPLVVACMLLAVAMLITTLLTRQFIRASEQYLESSTVTIEESLKRQFETQGLSIVSPLAANLVNPVYQMDMDRICKLLKVTLKQPAVISVKVVDDKGTLIHDGDKHLKRYGEPVLNPSQLSEINLQEGKSVQSQQDVMRLFEPIVIGDALIGGVVLELSMSSILPQVEANARQMVLIQQQVISRNFQVVMGAALLLTVLTVVAVLLANRRSGSGRKPLL